MFNQNRSTLGKLAETIKSEAFRGLGVTDVDKVNLSSDMFEMIEILARMPPYCKLLKEQVDKAWTDLLEAKKGCRPFLGIMLDTFTGKTDSADHIEDYADDAKRKLNSLFENSQDQKNKAKIKNNIACADVRLLVSIKECEDVKGIFDEALNLLNSTNEEIEGRINANKTALEQVEKSLMKFNYCVEVYKDAKCPD